jgi:rod shape-determining protein MreD
VISTLVSILGAPVAALLQVSVAPALLPHGFHPNVVLAWVIAWGARAGLRRAMIAGVAGGLVVDVWGVLPVGLSAVLYALVALLAIVPELRIVPTSLALTFALAAVGELIFQAMMVPAFQAVGRPVIMDAPAPVLTLLRTAATALTAVPFYFLAGFARPQDGPEGRW